MKKNYRIVIVETIELDAYVEAESEEEAENIARDNYDKGCYVDDRRLESVAFYVEEDRG